MTRKALFIATLLLAGTARGDCHNKALVVDEHAEGVAYRGCWQVDYVVNEAFPAQGLVGRLKAALLGEGWKTVDFDPIDPAASGPQPHAWTEHYLQDKNGTRVDEWIGWFIRGDMSRVQVALKYFGRSPEDKTPRQVTVRITFVSPEEWEKRPQ